MLLRVQNFCYFFNLRSGTLIFLWSVLVLSIVLSFGGLFLYKSLFGGLSPVLLKHVSSLFLPFWLYFILLFGILPYGTALYGVLKKKLFYVELCIFVNIFALVSWVVTLVVFVLLLIFSELPSTSLVASLFSSNAKVMESLLQQFDEDSMHFQSLHPKIFPFAGEKLQMLKPIEFKLYRWILYLPVAGEELQMPKPIEFKLYLWICIVCLTVLIALKWYLTSVLHSFFLLMKEERRRRIIT